MRRSEYRAVLAYFGQFAELQAQAPAPQTKGDTARIETTSAHAAPPKNTPRKRVATTILGGRRD